MPSTRLAVALTALVFLAGCSMVPGLGGSGDPEPTTTVPEGPSHHELVFASSTGGVPFNATVAVTKEGKTLFTKSVSADGNGTYATLTELSESGPYTVTVNTTIPGSGGENMSERFTVNGSLGNATVVRVTYQGIYHPTFRLPRRNASQVMTLNVHPQAPDELSGDVRVWYQGSLVAEKAFSVTPEGGWGSLNVVPNETGVYRVAINLGNGWTSNVVVVSNPDDQVIFVVGPNGYVNRIIVQPAGTRVN